MNILIVDDKPAISKTLAHTLRAVHDEEVILTHRGLGYRISAG